MKLIWILILYSTAENFQVTGKTYKTPRGKEEDYNLQIISNDSLPQIWRLQTFIWPKVPQRVTVCI